MRTAILLASSALLVVPMVTSVGNSAGAGPVLCHGERATIVGTHGDDDLFGTDRRDVIAGLGGRDAISGGGGNDLICGGGNPYVEDVDGYPMPENLAGGPGRDRIFGGPGFDFIMGDGGNDVLDGGGGDDRLLGHLGHDTLHGSNGDDHLLGGGGSDLMFGDAGADVVEGDADNDVSNGGSGNDELHGDAGDDRLTGGPGHDIANYAWKFTELVWSSHHLDISADLSAGRLHARWFGRDRLRETEEIWTGGGDDRLVGTSGRDTFFTSLGRDVVRAGAGIDTLSFDSDRAEGSGGHARVDLAIGRATFWSPGLQDVGHLRFTGIENVTGSGGHDTILGDQRANRLVGGPRGGYDTDDVIHGRGGDDVLLGKEGNDTLDGGTGENRIDGGDGVDTCTNPSSGPGTRSCEAPGRPARKGTRSSAASSIDRTAGF